MTFRSSPSPTMTNQDTAENHSAKRGPETASDAQNRALQSASNRSLFVQTNDALFRDKLALLALYYPKFLKTVLADLLRSCAGDLEAVRSFLSGSLPKKRVASTQASLGSFKAIKTDALHDLSMKNRLRNLQTARGNAGTRAHITLNTPEDVEWHLAPYVSLHLNFLPSEVSEYLLSDLMDRKDTFKYNMFYLFGNRCELSHLKLMFSRPDAAYTRLVYNGLHQAKPDPYPESMELACSILETFVNEEVIPKDTRPRWNLDAREDYEGTNEPLSAVLSCETVLEPRKNSNHTDSPKLQQVQNKGISASQDDETKSFSPEYTWKTDFCLVNCYKQLHNCLAWHSDRLSHIGPLNYVASLSLGATRVFCLKNVHDKSGSTFHIPLPHNSVLLMRPGCQEVFQHCVESMSKPIALHKSVGSLRFGITARHYFPFFIRNLPKCKCGIGMVLRRSYRNLATRGQYFWSCENLYQNKNCGSFYWCNFSNVSGHYIADKRVISTWIAPEDREKHEYERSRAKNQQQESVGAES